MADPGKSGGQRSPPQPSSRSPEFQTPQQSGQGNQGEGSNHHGQSLNQAQAPQGTSPQRESRPTQTTAFNSTADGVMGESGNLPWNPDLGGLNNDLHRLSFAQDNINPQPWATQNQLFKRSAEDLVYTDPALSPCKQRKTMNDVTQRQKKLSPTPQRSIPNMSSPKGYQTLNTRQKQASKPLTNTKFNLGHSHSDPAVGQSGDEVKSTIESPRQSRRGSQDSNDTPDAPRTSIVPQPDSKPIPESQLSAEIRAIYSGLVMVESKCITVDNAESARLQEIRSGKKPKSTLESNQNHWPAIISLHRALLQEHHDFFLASQHPAASEPLRRLAEKYSMPERMWKHGIRSPLELFRFGLPYSKEFMISFIILSYQMICLLYETVRSFKDTWIECLGDLARYRMAIEDEDPKDREIWSSVSRTWYSKASARQPRIGRLYHHQAILARTNHLKQLSFYARAVNAVYPFTNTRESIMTLLDPILARLHLPGSNKMTFDSFFNRLHAMLFTGRHLDRYEATLTSFIDGFEGFISQSGPAFKTQGEYMANVLIADLLKWGSPGDPMRALFSKDSGALPSSATAKEIRSGLKREWQLTFDILKVCLGRLNDENILPLLIMLLSFVAAVVAIPVGVEYIHNTVPLDQLTACGNTFLDELSRISVTTDLEQESEQLVLESFYGQVWIDQQMPPNVTPRVEDYEEGLLLDEYPESRVQKYKIVSILKKIASVELTPKSTHPRWISFSGTSGRFKISPISSDPFASSNPLVPKESLTSKDNRDAYASAVRVVGQDDLMPEHG